MNKVYEYVTNQEEVNDANSLKAEGRARLVYSGHATAFWAVKNFMEANELTERLYTKEDMLQVMNLGMDARNGQLRGDESRSGNEILEQFLTSLEK